MTSELGDKAIFMSIDYIEVVGIVGRYEDNPYGATCPGGLWHVEAEIKNLTMPIQEPR